MAPASCATLLRLSQAAAGLSHMRRKYLGCHPGRSAARSGALQTRDPSIPASEKRHGRGTWIPALATLGRDDNGGNGAICDSPAAAGERERAGSLPISVSPAPGGRGIDLAVDGFHRREGADERAFLPAAPVGELVARHVEATLRAAEHLGMRGKSFVALVGPAEARKFHVVPADGDPVLDPIGIARMQPVALLAGDVQPLGNRLGVELVGGGAIHVGAGEYPLGAQEAR